MFRKGMQVVVAIILVFSMVLSGCSSSKEVSNTGNSSGSGGAKGKITLWVYPYLGDGEADKEKKMWDDIKAGFVKDNPDAQLDIVTNPWDQREPKLLSAISAGTGPDLFYTNPDYVVKFAEKGIIAPITSYLKGFDMSDFTEASLKTTRYKGQDYGLPLLQSVVTVFYNFDIVKEIGEDPNNLPKTWDEFDKWAAKAKEKGKYAINFHGGGAPNIYIYPLIWQEGGDIIDSNGKVIVNSPATVTAFTHLSKMYTSGWIPSDSITSNDQVTDFRAGKFLASISDSTLYTKMLSQPPTFKWGVGELLGNKKQVTYGTTGSLVIPHNSKNKDGAVAFMKYLTGSEASKTFNSITKYLPARKTAYSIFNGDKTMLKFAEQSQHTLPGILHPIGPNVNSFATAEAQAVLLQKKTPQQAAADFAKELESEMKKEGQ
jgi:multiple sugar transport system substrate-binding protein